MKKSQYFTRSGFTIIELVIVITIIGILSAIVLVSYSGVTKKAVITSLQSDLANASEQLKIFKVQNNSNYPASNAMDCGATPAAGTVCFKTSSGNIATTLITNNSTNPKTFCVRILNNALSYYIDNTMAAAAVGACPGVTFLASTSWTVPINVTSIQLESWGAQGGGGAASVDSCGGYQYPGGTGGKGGYAKGTLSVTPGTVLTLNVGALGTTGVNGGESNVKAGSVYHIRGYGGNTGANGYLNSASCYYDDYYNEWNFTGNAGANGTAGGGYANNATVTAYSTQTGIQSGNGKVVLTY